MTVVLETKPDASPAYFAKVFLGVDLHPTQAAWLSTRAKVKTAACGRRWGKSLGEAIDLIWWACAYPETTQFLFAPTSDQSRIIMEYAAALLTHGRARRYVKLSPGGEVLRQSPFPEIQFCNGSSAHARTAGATGVPSRGRGADRVILDEAAYIPERIVKETILPFLANSHYAERVNISTPFGRNHFFEDFTRGDAGDPGYFSARYPSSASPYVSADYLVQQQTEMTSLQYRIEYLAEFAEEQNAVFPWTLIQSCIDQVDTLAPEPNHRYVLGYDPAKWTDRSGIAILDITQTPYRVCAIHDISGRDYLTQAAAVKDLSTRYNRAPVLLDATTHDQMLEQLMADGVNASGFTFTNQSKQELMNGLVICMEQGDLRLTNHRDLLDELKYYRYELTKAGNVKLGADEKHHDDLVTALALAVHHAASAPDLPYAWLRNDPEFRERALAPETDADRITRRRLAQGL